MTLLTKGISQLLKSSAQSCIDCEIGRGHTVQFSSAPGGLLKGMVHACLYDLAKHCAELEKKYDYTES